MFRRTLLPFVYSHNGVQAHMENESLLIPVAVVHKVSACRVVKLAMIN